MADTLSGNEGEDVQSIVELHEENTSNVSAPDCSSSPLKDTCRKCDKKVHITDLPPEVFEHILRYLTFDNIAKLRLVSRHFNNVCYGLLNSEFNRLRVMVQQRFLAIKAQMPRRESSRRKHPLARESDIIETLYMRLTLLNMTFGKHIERKYICFFAGEIIDEIYKILMYVQKTPSLSRAYKVTDELFDLSTMAMEYFKEHIEPSLPEVTYFASDVFEKDCQLQTRPDLIRARSMTPMMRSLLCRTKVRPKRSSATVRAQQSIQEETAAARCAEKAYKSPNASLQNLNKRFKIMSKKVNRNSRDIANMKRSVKVVSQKINSFGEVINQMKWQQKCCDATTLSDPSDKMNHIRTQLNLYKHEIEILTAKLSVCSDKKNKFDLESIGKNLNSNASKSNIFRSHSTHIKHLVNSSLVPSQELRGLEMDRNYLMMKPHSMMFQLKEPVKRKLPSCTITSLVECHDKKRSCIEYNDADDSK